MNSRTWLLGFCQLVLAMPFFALVLAALFLVVGGNLAGAAPAAAPPCHYHRLEANLMVRSVEQIRRKKFIV